MWHRETLYVVVLRSIIGALYWKKGRSQQYSPNTGEVLPAPKAKAKLLCVCINSSV